MFSCSAFRSLPASQASGYLHESWMTALSVMAMLTMTFGNVAAIMQNNVKRMLAYSSIAHAGYALVGFHRCRSGEERRAAVTRRSRRSRFIC